MQGRIKTNFREMLLLREGEEKGKQGNRMERKKEEFRGRTEI